MCAQLAERSGAARLGDPRSPLGLPPVLLFAGYGAVCLLPLLLAALQGHPVRNGFRELSSGLVMVSYIMTLLQFLLSGRFEWLSGRIGIDRTMRFHQVTSWVIVGLIVAHPLLYVIPRLASGPMEALVALNRMFLSPSLLSGWVS